ncbi:thermonuclease family protein [Paenochrobactrum sp. BZR 588]|uniref:thermonuclease family protein n=1 Tax=Paenochrobactrum sp. BZR 588 TaxID=3378076 RepID=UPI003857D3B5
MFRPRYGRKSAFRTSKQYRQLKRRRPLILDTLFALIILAAIAYLISLLPQASHENQGWSGIAIVIDGDTIILSNQRLRLKGIDAPEIKQTCQINNQAQACGVTAKQALQRKIARQAIHCTSTARDKYKRFLAICYLDQTELNQWMVEQGYAISYYDYPAQEHEARLNKRGIWAGKFERPQDWRKRTAKQEMENSSKDTYLDYQKFVQIIKDIYDRLFGSGETDE